MELDKTEFITGPDQCTSLDELPWCEDSGEVQQEKALLSIIIYNIQAFLVIIVFAYSLFEFRRHTSETIKRIQQIIIGLQMSIFVLPFPSKQVTHFVDRQTTFSEEVCQRVAAYSIQGVAKVRHLYSHLNITCKIL